MKGKQQRAFGRIDRRAHPLHRAPEVRTFGLYLAAGVSYVAVGVFVTELMLSWVVGFGWLLLWVWGLPALVRRLRR
jgi:hypothetical protein